MSRHSTRSRKAENQLLASSSGSVRFREHCRLSALTVDGHLRPKEHQLQTVFEGLAEQAITGLTLLEKETGDGWLVNDKFSQADIMTAICYQGGALLVLPDHLNAKNFTRLAALTE